MPLISPCIEPGCSKLCMGLFCIDHDSGPRADFPRGRPWPPDQRGETQVIAPLPPFPAVSTAVPTAGVTPAA